MSDAIEQLAAELRNLPDEEWALVVAWLASSRPGMDDAQKVGDDGTVDEIDENSVQPKE